MNTVQFLFVSVFEKEGDAGQIVLGLSRGLGSNMSYSINFTIY